MPPPTIKTVCEIIYYQYAKIILELEREIDRLVYELYGLAEEEIGIIENK